MRYDNSFYPYISMHVGTNGMDNISNVIISILLDVGSKLNSSKIQK